MTVANAAQTAMSRAQTGQTARSVSDTGAASHPQSNARSQTPSDTASQARSDASAHTCSDASPNTCSDTGPHTCSNTAAQAGSDASPYTRSDTSPHTCSDASHAGSDTTSHAGSRSCATTSGSTRHQRARRPDQQCWNRRYCKKPSYSHETISFNVQSYKGRNAVSRTGFRCSDKSAARLDARSSSRGRSLACAALQRKGPRNRAFSAQIRIREVPPNAYLARMRSTFEFCLPGKAHAVLTDADWLCEVKYVVTALGWTAAGIAYAGLDQEILRARVAALVPSARDPSGLLRSPMHSGSCAASAAIQGTVPPFRGLVVSSPGHRHQLLNDLRPRSYP